MDIYCGSCGNYGNNYSIFVSTYVQIVLVLSVQNGFRL